MPVFSEHSAAFRKVLAVLALGLLTACATSQDMATRTDGINDPYEAQNRRVHAFNKSLDKKSAGPSSRRYARIVPVEFRTVISNFAENLSLPKVAVNSLLQADLKGAGISTSRFLINTGLGLGGLFDAASEFGAPEHDTDFGQTLAVWGVGEGAYLELPIIGPTTQRGAVGSFVDIFTNPVTPYIESPEIYYTYAARYLDRLNTRARYDSTINSVLYDSADSYAQARLIYLQNRRFELGAENEAADPYADPYGVRDAQ